MFLITVPLVYLITGTLFNTKVVLGGVLVIILATGPKVRGF
jgi:hypothetical membrane protein